MSLPTYSPSTETLSGARLYPYAVQDGGALRVTSEASEAEQYSTPAACIAARPGWMPTLNRWPALAMLLALVLSPGLALAQAAQAASSGIGSFLGGLLTTDVVGGIVAGILAVLGGFLAKVITTSIRRRNVAIAVRHAYAAVEEIARLDERDNALDKVSAGLKELDKYLVANGWRPATEQEQQVARLEFTAISGAHHSAVKASTQAIANAALKEVLPVPPQPRAS